MILRAYKVRLQPTIEQARYLGKTAAASRIAHNWALAYWREWAACCALAKGCGSETGKQPNGYAVHAALTAIKHEQLPFLAEVSSYAIREAVMDVANGYKHFFRRMKAHQSGNHGECQPTRWGGCDLGEPRFRSRFKASGMGWHCDQGNACSVRPDAVWCPGLERLGSTREELGWIAVATGQRGYLPEHEQKLCGVGFRFRAGHWYAAIRAWADPVFVSPTDDGSRLSVEIGVSPTAALSNGRVFQSEQMHATITRAARKLALWQRRLSRRTRKDTAGRKLDDRWQSAGWREALAEVRKYNAQIADARANELHQISRRIVDTGAETIALKELALRGVVAGNQQRGMFELRRCITYKQVWRGGAIELRKKDSTGRKPPRRRKCA